MVLAKKGNYRVHTISKIIHIKENGELVSEEQPVSQGLGIERTTDGQSYFVIAFVRPDHSSVSMDTVSDRYLIALEDAYESDEVEDLIYITKSAQKLVEAVQCYE